MEVYHSTFSLRDLLSLIDVFYQTLLKRIIYSATLSFAAALSIIVYLRRKTKSIAYFTAGLVLLSITASLIGVNRFYLESDFLHGIETLLYAPTL